MIPIEVIIALIAGAVVFGLGALKLPELKPEWILAIVVVVVIAILAYALLARG